MTTRESSRRVLGPQADEAASSGPPAASDGRLLRLYGTLGCHLCDTAMELVARVPEAADWCLQSCDIVDDQACYQRYGVRIPVLRREDTGAELDWPFDATAVRQLLRAPTAE